MPSYEIRKGFDLARRFHDAYTRYRSSHLCQFAGHCEDQIGLSDGKDCRNEEWKTKRDTPFRAKLRQRTIREGLLTLLTESTQRKYHFSKYSSAAVPCVFRCRLGTYFSVPEKLSVFQR